MAKVCNEIATECLTCATRKRNTTKHFHIPSPINIAAQPFQVISMDFKPMSSEDPDGNDSLLCVCDRFTGYHIAIPHRSTDKAERIAKLLCDEVYDTFGTPRVILSDSDPVFESKIFKEAHARLNCAVETGTPYHYRTSGGIEIRIKHLQDQLNILSKNEPNRWWKYLKKALYIVNSTENPLTHFSPLSLLLGYRPTTPLDLLREHKEDLGCSDLETITFDDVLTEFIARRDTDRAIHNDNRRQARASAERKAAATIRPCPDYAVGTWVVLHKRAFGPQFQNHLSKLESREGIGPFRILELCDHGRVRVDLEQQFTMHKTNMFSLDDVNKFYRRRPRAEFVLGAGDHDVKWNESTEFEVEAVERRWIRGRYQYKVMYKGYDGAQSRKWKPKDAPEFTNCQDIINDYDEANPYGSLRRDHVPHKRDFERKRRSLRRSPRIVAARLANANGNTSLKDQLVEHHRKVNSLVNADRGCPKFVDARVEDDASVVGHRRPAQISSANATPLGHGKLSTRP
jgi:hypothetical protein